MISKILQDNIESDATTKFLRAHTSEHDINIHTLSIIIGKSFLKMLKNYIPSSNWSSLDGKLCCLHQISQPVIASSRYPLDVSDANQYSSVEKHQIKKINTQAYS